MPTYGYKCRECEEEFEVFQKMSDAPVSECPNCGGAVKRVFHPVGIIFKGSGFYTTDYKNKSGTNPPAKKSSDTDKSSDTKKSSEKATPEKATT